MLNGTMRAELFELTNWECELLIDPYSLVPFYTKIVGKNKSEQNKLSN